ncbi:putative porin [Sporomusa sp.]|uniref:putative porin n=1 Tax=Sporomusa sp. TaxID=2078658 RepID=UPI002CFE6A01|nr:putative porin [Sporomusa sp.]HWR07897.1 putative porin [Sporomusa sp.]
MQKKIALALGAAFSISVAGTVLAASANLFAVVPEHHWSYSAVGQLAKAGIVEGFGGSVYREDVMLTRVEMAAIVAKAIAKADKAGSEDQAVIKKLQAEFAPELNMGSTDNTERRLEKLEKGKSSVKISGDARLRYQSNWNQNATNKDAKNTTRMEQRVRLNISSEVAENVTLLGRVAATNRSNVRGVNELSKTSKNNTVSFDRAEFQWKNKETALSVGRILPALGQGLLWDYNSVDGAMATYNFGNAQLSAGYGDLAAYTASGNTTNAFLANLKVNVGSATNITVGHLNTMSNNFLDKDKNKIQYDLEQTAVGFTTKTGEFTVTGEYVKNSDSKLPANAQDHGYWGRLLWKGIDNSKPGTVGISFDYLSLGNCAIDSYNNPGTLVVSGGNSTTGIGGDGAKGYGFGVQYVVAKNANVEARYYNLKPYDQGKSTFSSYKDSYHLIGNFKF